MSKVIVERPRRRGYGGKGIGRDRQVDHDLMVSKEGMRAPHVRNWSVKELNENLAPLVRFLRSRLGRRWDDVYSEISQHLRVTNAVQQHVRDHVEDFVAVRTRLADGEVWVTSRYGRPQTLRQDWHQFYVDPDTGLLRANPHVVRYLQRRRLERQRRQAEEASRLHVDANGTEYRKIYGLWYEVLWDHVPPPGVIRQVDTKTGEVTTTARAVQCRDVFTDKVHSQQGQRYRCGRRQISRAELRRLGLANNQSRDG